jgi:hypothetical protein
LEGFTKYAVEMGTVGIATGYGLDGRGIWSSNPGRGIILFCSLNFVETDSGAHPASYSVGTEGKAAEA